MRLPPCALFICFDCIFSSLQNHSEKFFIGKIAHQLHRLTYHGFYIGIPKQIQMFLNFLQRVPGKPSAVKPGKSANSPKHSFGRIAVLKSSVRRVSQRRLTTLLNVGFAVHLSRLNFDALNIDIVVDAGWGVAVERVASVDDRLEACAVRVRPVRPQEREALASQPAILLAAGGAGGGDPVEVLHAGCGFHRVISLFMMNTVYQIQEKLSSSKRLQNHCMAVSA
jgi:hypothetical protein